MKNITVSIDDETYRLSRIQAAAAGTSVSALVRGVLTRLAAGGLDSHLSQSDQFARLLREQDAVISELLARAQPFCASDRLSRDEIHERDAVR
jgi:hypothetical protein